MGQHPLNLALRFILEIVTLTSVGYWGWVQHEGILRYGLTISLPLITAVLWATFRVVGEAGGGQPLVAVPGLVRLLLELAILSFAIWGLHNAGAMRLAWGIGVVVFLHYLISYDRIWWLIQN
jgi:hypothetical protein